MNFFTIEPIENLPVFEKPLTNIAYGLYSHFSTTFETDSLVSKIKGIADKNIPVVICKLRSDENTEYTLSALCDCGVSWLFGDYKGPAGDSYLYTGNPEPADFDNDNFDAITEKWAKPLATKNFEQNKELAATLKSHFGRGNVYVENTSNAEPEKGKLQIKVKFGANFVFGSKSGTRKLKKKTNDA